MMCWPWAATAAAISDIRVPAFAPITSSCGEWSVMPAHAASDRPRPACTGRSMARLVKQPPISSGVALSCAAATSAMMPASSGGAAVPLMRPWAARR